MLSEDHLFFCSGSVVENVQRQLEAGPDSPEHVLQAVCLPLMSHAS